jgi:hypothetical protein
MVLPQAKAFSGEAATGVKKMRQIKNLSNQEFRVPFRFYRNRSSGVQFFCPIALSNPAAFMNTRGAT